MKPILQSDRLTMRIAFCGMLIAATLMLSYLESYIPTGLLTGIPGVKLGLPNIAVIMTFYIVGRKEAIIVSLLRIVIFSLLFGNVTSFLFSLLGGTLALVTLFITYPIYQKCIGMLGISVISAAMHNIGQICAAALLMKTTGVFAYLPLLLLAAIPCGAITGIIAYLLITKLKAIRLS